MADRYLLIYDAEGVLIRETDGEKTRTAGSWEAMSQLSGRTNAVQALVTGMSADDAAVLMKEVTGLGLDRYLDMEIGGYGATDLAGLAAAVRERATAKYDTEFTVVVVAGPGAVAEVAAVADAVVSTDESARADGAKHVVKNLLELVPLVLENRVA